MHIGMVLPSLTGGGAERVTLALADALIGRGHRVDVLVGRFVVAYPDDLPAGLRLFRPKLRPNGRLARRCRAHGVPVHDLDIVPAARDWRALAAVRRRTPVHVKRAIYAGAIAKYVRAERPTLLLAGVEHAQMAALCAVQLEGCAVPLAVVLHGSEIPLQGKRLAVAQALYSQATLLIAVSRGLAASVEQALNLAAGTVKAIYNPVPAEKIKRLASEPVPHPWFAGGEPPVVLAICGPRSPFKDPETLLAALALLRQDAPVRLALIGRHEHRFRRNLAERAQALDVADHVVFIEFDPNPFRYMRRAAMVALSSRSEGLPTVLIEALACGTPVVSTDTPYGPAEILCDGKFGKLVPLGDPEAMAQAMLATLRGDRPASEALERRAQEFSSERAVRQYESAFVQAVESARPAREASAQTDSSSVLAR